jgi:hypothetical protein
VHEEPFAASELQRLNSFIDQKPTSEPLDRSELNSFIDQVRKPAPY